MKSTTVTELKEKFDKKESFDLLDVREDNELLYAKIDPHINIPIGSIMARHEELNKEKAIVVMCHTGVRSAQACQYLETLGYNVTNLEGGIHAWSLVVDPSVSQY
ncbi:MAG: rhodanese-like domain-containing protein [Fidelibacterota bacterium]|jgi:rhodanese-related sulfurtransferase|tara:strand:+ start:2215 stop:2529 length:315 start_codon:yes stop_codon:yes gene_type:complete